MPSNDVFVKGITINKKSIKLGRFNDEIEAAKVRNEATIKYFGEYGNLNGTLPSNDVFVKGINDD